MDMVGDYSDEAPLGIFLEIPFQNKQMNKLTNEQSYDYTDYCMDLGCINPVLDGRDPVISKRS